VRDIDSLREFLSLSELDVSDSISLEKISRTLSSGPGLHHFGLLNARNVFGIEEISGLPRLGALESLHLRNSPLLTLRGVERWAATLTRLSLQAPDLDDIELAGSLPGLEVLNASQVPVSDLGFLARLPKLGILQIRNDEQALPTLGPIRDLENLRCLSCGEPATLTFPSSAAGPAGTLRS
jgi:hypothetical protein